VPASKVHPEVVEAMREVGLDLSAQVPQLLTEEMLRQADRVITMGCSVQEACPAVLVESEDWGLEDPAGRSLAMVRQIRDQVRERVGRLLADLTRP